MGEDWHDWTAQTAFVPFTSGLAYPGTVALVGGTLLFLIATWAPSHSGRNLALDRISALKRAAMTRKFFGTDGIRGTTNIEPMTAETALRVGQAAGAHFLRGDHRHRVVIGKDTRLSGYMMELAMVAGFTSVGMDVVLLGPMPTPAVAMLTRSMRADLGVMISASHNPFADNGIKLFGPDGYKLSDDAERAIERRLEKEPKLAKSEMIGRARRIDDARGRYIQFAKSTFPEHLRLDGLKVVARLRQWRRLPRRARSAVGARRRGHPARRLAQWPQHQRQLRLDQPAASAGDGGCERRRHRHCPGRRRRPPDRGRREGPIIDGDQLMALIALGAEGARRAQGRRGGRDGHVQPRARAEARRSRPEAAPNQSRRPLRARRDAQKRLQCRRRAVGPHHPDRPCDDR